MKRFFSLIILIIVLTTPVFATSVNTVNTDLEATPYGTGNYYGTLELMLDIPSYNSPLGYTVDAWSCPIDIKYRMIYDLNTGEILSVIYLSTEITPGMAMSPTEQGRLVSLNSESATMKIIDNGYAFRCNYTATADLIYVQFPGLPIAQESVSCSVRGTATVVDPPRP